MNICFIAIDHHTKSSGGGIASYIDTLSKQLAKQGHSVIILIKAGSDSLPSKFRMSNPQLYPVALGDIHYYVHKVPFLGKRISAVIRELEWALGIWLAMRKILKERSIDIIESQEIGNSLLMLFLRQCPIVIRAHGAPYNIHRLSGETNYWGDVLCRAIEVWSMRRACCVTVPSRFQAEEIARELGHDKSKVITIPNPLSLYMVGESQKERVLQDKGFTVLYTGRIEYRKGIIPLLRCVREVIREQADVQFVLAGGYHVSLPDKTVRKIIEQEGIAGHVQLKGHVPWQQLVYLYKNASIFVMPSYYETFCISCIEAMAFGLPVVVATSSALVELIEDEVTGLLVPAGDSGALARTIIRLLKNKALRQRIGEAGRRKVLAEFRVEKVALETIRVYNTVCSDRAEGVSINYNTRL